MRRSELAALADHVFGPALASAHLAEIVLVDLDGRTGAEALAQGVPPKRVWTALCDEMEVPESRRWEIPPEARRR